jgi:hypothetical protein
MYMTKNSVNLNHGDPERQEEETSAEKLFEEILAKNSPNLVKGLNLQHLIKHQEGYT